MATFFGTVAAFALLSLAGVAAIAPAQARPPTVMNSPGYDARLAESRKALQGAPAVRPSPSMTPAAPPQTWKRKRYKHR